HIILSQDCPVVVIFSTLQMSKRVDVLRKNHASRNNKINDSRYHDGVRRVLLLEAKHHRIVDRAQYNAFLAVGKNVPSHASGDATVPHGRLECPDVTPKAIGGMADFSGILLNYIQGQRVRLATQ